MARYRRTTAEVLYTDKFRGLDLTEGEKKSFSSSVYMKNFRVTDQYRLKKRCGYRKLVAGVYADSCFHAQIGGCDYFIYKRGRYLFAVSLPDGRSKMFDSCEFSPAGYFKFNGKICIVCRKAFFTFDGRSFSRIEPYIPTVAVACSPSGGGTLHESLNTLSDKARISYSPDGESVSFTLPAYADAVVSVFSDGDYVSPFYYVYDRTTRTITFNDPPEGGVPDSLTVTFSMTDGAASSMPAPGDRFCIYGGDRDTRVFSYGKDGTIRYSDVTAAGPDPTYFPADNFIRVCDNGEKVTALIRHYDRLIVFTERQTWFLSPSSVTYAGQTKPSFPLSPLNSTVGCAGGGAAYADNTPFTLSYDGIYVFGQSTIRDERNAKRISDRIAPYLSDAFLTSAVVYDHEREREIWMCFGGCAVVYNYGVDAYYYYDDVPAEYVFGIGENVAFYSGSDIFMFDPTVKTDDGRGIAAVYETADAVLDVTAKKRRLRRAGMVFTSENGARVFLSVIPNRGNTGRLVFHGAPFDGGFDFGALDFTSFSFLCGRKPVHTEQRIPLSSFETLRLRIECAGDDKDVTVSSVSLTADGS